MEIIDLKEMSRVVGLKHNEIVKNCPNCGRNSSKFFDRCKCGFDLEHGRNATYLKHQLVPEEYEIIQQFEHSSEFFKPFLITNHVTAYDGYRPVITIKGKHIVELGCNDFDNLPESLGDLKFLWNLNLRGSRYIGKKGFPESFEKLNSLEWLNLAQYLSKVGSNRASIDLLEGYRPSYRKKLLEVIVSNCEILQSIDQKYKLSWILMGDKDLESSIDDSFSRTFLRTTNDKDQHRPDVATIVQLLRRVSEWNIEQFRQLGPQFHDITEAEITKAKEKITLIVTNWVEKAHIFTGKWTPYSSHQWNPYNPLALSNIKGFSTQSGQMERLIGLLWYACSMHTDNPGLTFEDIKDNALLGSSKISLLDIIEGNRKITTRLLKGAVASIQSWIKQESQIDIKNPKLRAYFSIITQIGFLALTNGISLKGSGGEKIFKGRKFEEEYIMAYHVFTGLGKHLGIDPLTLTVIDDEGFEVTNDELQSLNAKGIKLFRFLRHHFRDTLTGRISFLHSDIVITDTSKHITWETLSEEDSLVIIKGYEKLINMDKAVITPKDIENVFKGNEWVVAKWKDSRRFTDNLNEFNNRRKDIRLMGIKGFIAEYNPIAYERFSKALEQGRNNFNTFMLELHEDLIENDLASNDIFVFLHTYLQREGYLINVGKIQ